MQPPEEPRTMSEEVHAERRHPAAPDGPIVLEDFAEELLEEARTMSSGRSARTLTPQVGVTLKQTLMALVEGRALDKHRAPSRATIQVLRGSVTIDAGDEVLDLEEGSWAVIPEQEHGVTANSDAVFLLTVGETS
jgi:quercetin dioxygenase-like cupin family protein